MGGDAVEGEPGPPSVAQDPPGHVLRWGGAAAAEQFQQHERLVDVAHAHLLGDVLAQALVGGGGGRGHGGILAGVTGGGTGEEEVLPPGHASHPSMEQKWQGLYDG